LSWLANWGIRGIAFQAVNVLLVLNLIWFSTTWCFCTTPYGRQCRTAAVQTLQQQIYNCCHELVGYQMRPVRPGDKQFIQCRCEEKSELQQKVVLSPKLDLGLPRLIRTFTAEPLLPRDSKFTAYLLDDEQNRPAPPNPPPSIA
jgi:hypothetical protein